MPRVGALEEGPFFVRVEAAGRGYQVTLGNVRCKLVAQIPRARHARRRERAERYAQAAGDRRRGLVGVCELKLVHKLCFLLGERRVANAGGGEAEHKPVTAAEEAKEEEI